MSRYFYKLNVQIIAAKILFLIIRCGEVTDVYITEKGYAFVTMADDNGADMAIKELNGSIVDGQEIKVDNAHSNSGGDRRGGRGGHSIQHLLEHFKRSLN